MEKKIIVDFGPKIGGAKKDSALLRALGMGKNERMLLKKQDFITMPKFEKKDDPYVRGYLHSVYLKLPRINKHLVMQDSYLVWYNDVMAFYKKKYEEIKTVEQLSADIVKEFKEINDKKNGLFCYSSQMEANAWKFNASEAIKDAIRSAKDITLFNELLSTLIVTGSFEDTPTELCALEAKAIANKVVKGIDDNMHYYVVDMYSADDDVYLYNSIEEANEKRKSLFGNYKFVGSREKTVKHKGRYTPIVLKDLKRVGPEYVNGRFIDGDVYQKDLNIRAGEFGNWLTEADRENVMVNCYDAFRDMADVLGVDPKRISLNGDMAIAFGSRGVAGALAHYEPYKRVINLSKEKGTGTLAHEFGHAFDHACYKYSKKEFNSSVLLSEEFLYDYGVFGELINKLTDKNGNYYKASLEMDRKYSSAGNGYWRSPCEMFARAFACYISDKLSDMGRQNDFLCGLAYDKGQPTLSVCSEEEKEQIYDLMDKVIEWAKEIEVI